NILKHARASVVSIYLTMDADRIMLIISDNGQGCDLSKNTEGIGILNMYSRVESQGGKMSISSKPGEGFLLKIAFPGIVIRHPN
ncbi:MAG TPA: hypothetical protein VE035_16600, partial [Puia sp.]|nr:hypothetical protein [Puia sp.]